MIDTFSKQKKLHYSLALCAPFLLTANALALDSLPFTAPVYHQPSAAQPAIQTAPSAQATPATATSSSYQSTVPLRNPVLGSMDPQKFFSAIDSGDVQSVKSQLSFSRSFGQDYIEIRDMGGNTPLIRSAILKKPEVFNYLIEAGADINAQNFKGETALTISYANGSYNEANLLVSKGAADPHNIKAILHQIDMQEAEAAEHATLMNTLAVGSGIAAAGGGIALAAGGGGKSSATPAPVIPPPAGTIHPQNLSPGDFLTAEGLTQSGVVAMNTQYALARGYDGRIYSRNSDGTLAAYAPTGYVKVAVVDTGVDMTHSDIAANMLTGLSVTCNDSGCVSGGSDTEGHGTFVAGIIGALRNNVGIYGVASQAKIMSIGFADNTGTLTFGDIPGIKYALDNGAQVFNGSYGIPNKTVETLTPSEMYNEVNFNIAGTNYITQFQRGVTNHAIFVYSAGNDSLPSPSIPAGLPHYFQGATAPSGVLQSDYDTINPGHYDWSKNWVAVVSVDSNNVISSFSNQCGVAMNWCLAAPGENITSLQQGSGYATGNGTSFAAPNVTGAVAVMLGAFPQLTPEKVLQILFDTATDLGAAGVDAVYGHGLVNLKKATDPSDGGWSLTSLGSTQPFSFYSSGFGLSAPFGNALNASNLKLQFLDSYGKNYTIPLSVVSHDLTPTKTLNTRFSEFANTSFDTVTRAGNTQLGFSAPPAILTNDHDTANATGKMSYQSSFAVGKNGDERTFFAVNYRTNLADVMTDVDQKRLSLTDSLKNPYLAMVDTANSGVLGYEFGNTKVSMVAYSGKFQDEYLYHFNEGRNISGAYMEMKYSAGNSKSNISLNEGMSIEQQGFLGSEASGAFNINKSSTYYTGVTGELALTDHLSLLGNYHMGITQIAASADSIFTGFDSITTNAFAVGTEYTGITTRNDSLSFIVSQPLRVTSGAANLTLPTGINSNGDIFYNDSRLSLSPGGRELDLETSYHIPFADHNEFSFSALVRSEPNNANSASRDALFLGKYNLGF